MIEKLVLEHAELVGPTKEASLEINLCLLRVDLEATGGRGGSEAVRGPGLGKLCRFATARCGLSASPGDSVHNSTDAGSKDDDVINIIIFNVVKDIGHGFEDRNLVELPDTKCNMRVIIRRSIEYYEH